MNIVQASTDGIDALDQYVDRIKSVMGHANALVTDESRVSDFLTLGGKDLRQRRGKTGVWVDVPADPIIRDENDRKLREWQAALRVPFTEKDLIVDIARMLKGLASA